MIYRKRSYGVEVLVRPFFLKEHSSLENETFVWAYEIQIENHGLKTVQLLSRHWIIKNAKGEIEEVFGPGVVGKQPVIAAGDSFRYSSFTRLSTTEGTMRGSYRMMDQDGEMLDVEIPEFDLRFPVRLVPTREASSQL